MEIIGRSPRILAALQLVERHAASVMPILLVGETGTGKELFAQHVHALSGRAGGLVTVDCGALPGELIESMLFGHRRGAFTGALEHVEGLIAQADGGTLLLDELGSLPLRGQMTLLRVLERREVRRIGGSRTRLVDFRLVATAQREIADKVSTGSFRLDLLQRVSGAVVSLPSLEERAEDIPALARYFAREVGVSLSEAAETALAERAWPGNVRELRWAVLRSAMACNGNVREVSGSMMKVALRSGAQSLLCGSDLLVDGLAELKAVCREHEGDPVRVAESLGIARSTLYRRLREAGLRLGDFRTREQAHG